MQLPSGGYIEIVLKRIDMAIKYHPLPLSDFNCFVLQVCRSSCFARKTDKCSKAALIDAVYPKLGSEKEISGFLPKVQCFNTRLITVF